MKPLRWYWGWIALAWIAAPIILLAILFGVLALSHRDISFTQSEPAAASGLPGYAMTRQPRSEIRVISRLPYTAMTTDAPSPAPLGTYSCSDVAQAMRTQGFSEEAIRVGSGVVMAESGGRSNATAITERERSIGPFQVNTLVHKYSDECLRSLLCATAVAWKISSGGTNWSPWTAYRSGAYLGRCA